MATEEAKYTVKEKAGSFELRQYEPQIVAETAVEGDFEKVGNEGFRRLFGYISGNNRKKQSIAMTAPVAQQPGGEKIATTAPVNQVKEGGQWIVSFLMPPIHTMDTLPEPTDPRVRLRQIPGRLVAAIRYSGTWSRRRYDEHEGELRAEMQKRGLKPSGDATWARYNPPFTLWFLRRNEVLIPVSQAGQ